ncbi:acyl-CoA thioesterase-1 [Aliiroseovarius halocynthiae]|uniref:Arylesterase n=1 Tax=Aliiroseovarius halocynthiae TaxID=985055 RepID=A0A545SRN9_9RHOB|nr:arylesterase [Aliiroseovarius halocynthiae]TQV67617.1 arylesterase [Aliiroseovarius halocynthiae]SMR81642.1 acyl-CoA thioesterase-1 [Aliiroseovarius halocynthiae]
MVSRAYGVLTSGLKGLIAAVLMNCAAHAETTTILAIGDSLTAGYGLPQGEGFVPQLEAALNAQGLNVHIVNAGVSGDTSAGGAARLGWILTDEVDVALVALGGNDMLRGISPEETQRNLSKILTELGNKDIPTLLVGMLASANFGEVYRTEFQQVFPDLAETFDVALFPDFLEGIASAGSFADAQRLYLQADGLHPNREGVALIVDKMVPAVVSFLR